MHRDLGVLALTEERWTMGHVHKEYGDTLEIPRTWFLACLWGRIRRANAGWARKQSSGGQTNLTSKGAKEQLSFPAKEPMLNI